MTKIPVLSYIIKDALELNLSYMPFISNGGLFIPTKDNYNLGDEVTVNLQLPSKNDVIEIAGKVVWCTPKNALHHVIAGIGIQFTNQNAASIRTLLESLLDKTVDVGGYTYGITDDTHRNKS